MKNNDSKLYLKLFSLLKLETTTKYGRINLGGVLIIAVFCLLYTVGDGIGYILSVAENLVKSIALKQDIYHKYASVSVIEVVIPILIAFISCLVFLAWHEMKKKK
ncbi:hypothetical protein ACI3DN_12590 [Sellimonas catena]|uniref:Uncharacterized protein n=1 Tax=Sellimonas catena TaxID=2994035 RepID=A0A9W6FE79_9FIRM|nr:hypothetical protein [Sellimonas catena]GLG06368.1 hypothetical protein Selli1_35420 [Sellimonas catena]